MYFIAGNRAFEFYNQAYNYCVSSDWDTDIIQSVMEEEDHVL